jgi:putative ABC transport system permease protein
MYDGFDQVSSQPVCLIGSAARLQLDVGALSSFPTIWIGDRACIVIGIVDRSPVLPGALLGVIAPTSTATELLGSTSNQQAAPIIYIQTAQGAAQLIADQAPVALLPAHPEYAQATAPPDPKTLRQAVVGDVNALIVLLAIVSFIIGALGIANTTLVAVLERVPEIGLRRSLGARRSQIAAQFLAETTIVGTIGGLFGNSVGITIVVLVSATKHWSPTLDPRLFIVAPLLGTLTGLAAGLQPAWRATRIEPTDALRR